MNKQLAIILGLLLITMSIGFAETIARDDGIEVIEEQKLMIDALRNFIDEKPQAADEMEYIIQKREDAARKKANELLDKMASEEELTPTEDREKLSDGALDYTTRKLNLALVYFYESKYWLTIKECSNVLAMDPKNTLAWIRRGSGYYMLEKYDEAKHDWELALSLSPKASERKDLEEYLAKINELTASTF